MCNACGNADYFFYTGQIEAKITNRDGSLIFRTFDLSRQEFQEKDRIAAIVNLHMRSGAGTTGWSLETKRIRCGRCDSEDILPYGEILAQCYENECVGCFSCGGAFSEDNIRNTCEECVSMRGQIAEDSGLFWTTLDMDLYCDACPIASVREDYGITGEEIKAACSGKIKTNV